MEYNYIDLYDFSLDYDDFNDTLQAINDGIIEYLNAIYKA